MIERSLKSGASLLLTTLLFATAAAEEPAVLPGTERLEMEGDIAAELVARVDRFLLAEIAKSPAQREQFWNRDFSSAEAYNKSVGPNRQRLAHILGVRDPRVKFEAPELVATVGGSALVGRGEGYDIFAVRWPVLADPDPNRETVVVHGEGLLLVPTKAEPIADVVAIPDADQTPEQIVGLAEGVPAQSQFARRLAESGCRVIVPVLVSRELKPRMRPGAGGGATLTNREYVYRSAFELGRHIIGYELQKVLAAVDWFAKEAEGSDAKIGVVGYGEGGMLAMYAAALDTRIDDCTVSGYFGPRESIWSQPLDRNVFRLLREFGDAEIAGMIVPRKLTIDAARGPQVELPGQGGAPATLASAGPNAVAGEFERIDSLAKAFAGELGRFLVLVNSEEKGQPFLSQPEAALNSPPRSTDERIDAAARQQRQVEELDQFNQLLLRESSFVRKEFMAKLDTSSVEAYEKSVEPYREIFRKEVIGDFGYALLPPGARTRMAYETEKWTGYEVVLDVWPVGGGSKNVIAYGVLLLPKDLKRDGSERRPVVVCQHGLEGRPQDIISGDHPAYHDFAAKLAERGFITFAPQNLYIGKDNFRTLQRKANPLGKTLFSIIAPQHQQIINWLKTLPYVDDERIAFYGLSYGGKTAMRVPALVTDYCLSICSADFNEWVLKNASTRHPFSYVWTGEYEIFEFDLGSTFNYAEMAALICPRPFMVERGHFDGVGWDEWVAYEFAKVRHLYQAKLGIGERTEIEWFVGPHTINGQGTYDFLHRHLNWPKSAAASE
ncbi:MAG: dienelactone hydrolase family protein [Planctomycetes bacterium]|nr:dienelactone hydrolase family protein [Planctomycetota bacterium]